MRKPFNVYIAPQAEVVEVGVEHGFQPSQTFASPFEVSDGEEDDF